MAVISNNLISDRVLSQYGIINFEITNHNVDERDVMFKDKANEAIVFAFVFFKSEYSGSLSLIHKKVLSGALIGQTIKSSGYEYIREVYAGIYLDVTIQAIFWSKSYCTLSNIYIGIDNKSIYYCTICELFNPTFNLDRYNSATEEDIKQIEKILSSKDIIFNIYL